MKGLNSVAVPTLITAVVLSLMGCSATVSCPQEQEDPRAVFLLNHGRHATLAVTDGQGGLERFGYGDWRYYGQSQTGVQSATRALFWPTPSTLGRQQYAVAAPTHGEVISAVRVGIAELYRFELPATAVDRLRARLNTRFETGAQEALVVSPYRDFKFVPYPRDYWLRHNSNHAVAAWFEELGCEVRGFVAVSRGMSGEGEH